MLSHPFKVLFYKKAYSVILNKEEPLLMEKYAPLMRERKEYYATQPVLQRKQMVNYLDWDMEPFT